MTSDSILNFNVEKPLDTFESTATEQELNMDWAAENVTFTSFLNSNHHGESEPETTSAAVPESTIYSPENTICSGSHGLDGVNDGSDYLFALDDSFTVPQVDYLSEFFSSQWPFLPPGRSSDSYPPPKFAADAALSSQLNQDDLVINKSDNGLENLNFSFS